MAGHFEDVELSPRDESPFQNPSHLTNLNKSSIVKSSTLEESSHGDRTRVNVISKYQSASQHNSVEQHNANNKSIIVAMGEIETPDMMPEVVVKEIPLMVSQVQLRRSRERNND